MVTNRTISNFVTILVIDDNPDLLDDLFWVVDGKDRSVEKAGSLKEALELICKNEFDIVVTDLNLKHDHDKLGLKVVEKAIERNPNCKVIVVTDYNTPTSGPEAMLIGAYDYIKRNDPTREFFPTLQDSVRQALKDE